MSEQFWQFFSIFTLCFLVTGTVIAVFASLGKSGSGRYSSPEATTMWVKPVVVAAGAANVWGEMIDQPSLWLISAVAFVIGLMCGLTAIPPLLFGRDLVLGIISVVVTATIVFLRLTSGTEMALVYLLLLGALAAGIAFGGFKRVLEPITYIALLGALEMLDYLLSPFGPSHFSTGIPVVVVGVAGALILGVLIRFSPELVVMLGGLSIAVLAVVLQVFLWFEWSNFPESGVQPDWTAAVAWVSLLIGYSLLRVPFAMSNVKRLF